MPLAKLARPNTRLVHPRRRLFAWLDGAVRRGAVWVEGPPGAGKTSLLASWLDARARPALWLRVDEADGELATFTHYLAQALTKVRPGAPPLPRFSAECQSAPAAFARRFFRALWAALPASGALVLDECQRALEVPIFREALAWAAEERPTSAALVLVSRAAPPPELARLRVQDGLRVLGADALRLTLAETRGLAKLRRPSAAAAEVRELHARADGWAAGLVLLLAGRGAGRDHDGAPLVFDYLAGEVLDRLDARSQRVLLETALLDEVTAEAAAELTGDPGAADVLAGLARRGCFTDVHGTHGAPSFLFHPLFRELLLARGERVLGAERRRELRRRCGVLLAARGELEPALAHLLAAGEARDAARALVSQARVTIAEGRHAALRRWILALPEALREGEPWLQYWLGLSWFGQDLRALQEAMERAHAGFLARGDPAGAVLACAGAVDGYFIEWGAVHGVRRWAVALEDARRRWPKLPSPVVEAFADVAQYTASQLTDPGAPTAPELERRATAQALGAGDPLLRRKAAFSVAYCAAFRGELELARRALGALAVESEAWREPSANLAWAILRATCAALSGAPDEAAAEAARGLAVAESTGVHGWDVGLEVVGAWAAALSSDWRRWEAHLAAAEAVPLQRGERNRAWISYVRGLGSHLRGDPAATAQLQDALSAALLSGTLQLALWARVGLAADALRRGDRSGFESLAAAAEAASAAQRSECTRFWLLLLRAHAASASAPGRAAELLVEAARVEAPQGRLGAQWLTPGEEAALCAHALAAGAGPTAIAYARARGLAPPAAARRTGDWPFALRIQVLGGLEVTRDGVPVRFGRKAPRRTLALLEAIVLLGGAEGTADWRLAEALWPESEADAAHHALEVGLHRLRRLLGDARALAQHDGRVGLDGARCWVDALALEELLGEPAPSPEAKVERARAALALYRGPPDASDPWVAGPRERLRRKLRLALDEACASLRAAGDAEAAASLRRSAHERDPELAAPALRLVPTV